jgi:hypothetical protein
VNHLIVTVLDLFTDLEINSSTKMTQCQINTILNLGELKDKFHNKESTNGKETIIMNMSKFLLSEANITTSYNLWSIYFLLMHEKQNISMEKEELNGFHLTKKL